MRRRSPDYTECIVRDQVLEFDTRNGERVVVLMREALAQFYDAVARAARLQHPEELELPGELQKVIAARPGQNAVVDLIRNTILSIQRGSSAIPLLHMEAHRGYA